MTNVRDHRRFWAAFTASRRGAFLPIALLYGALFSAFGTEAPFFPSFLASRSLDASQIGFLLSIGSLVRVAVGPMIGVAADRFGVRTTLAVAALTSGLVGFGYLLADSFAQLLVVGALHAFALASLSPLSDALAVSASAREQSFDYGWVRGIGSASFVAATLLSGLVVGAFGLASIVVVSSILFMSMASVLPRVPAPPMTLAMPDHGGLLTGLAGLIAVPAFGRILMVAGMVIGSQAMADSFAVIHWREDGMSPVTISLLWSEAVTSEVGVLLALGPVLLRRLGAGWCATIAACAGIVQWGTLASTTEPALLAFSQPLHGLTFALMHLSTQDVISARVPNDRLATAQTLYGTFALGLGSILLTLASGKLYGSMGAKAFWLMSVLCAAAVPLAVSLCFGKDRL